jgi:hypothetical protein
VQIFDDVDPLLFREIEDEQLVVMLDDIPM